MVTPAMLREGLTTPDTAYHAWVGAKRAIEERCVSEAFVPSLKQLNIPGDGVVCRRPGGEWDLKRILDKAMLFYVSTGGPRCNVEAYLHNQLVELGASMADRVDGPHYTFVDPRYHDDAATMVKQALRLARLFAKQGYGRERLVVTVSGLIAFSSPL